MAIKLNITDIQYMNLFSLVTHVRAVDCFSYNNNIVFVVRPGCVLRAVGEGGENIKRISQQIKRKIKVVAQPMTSSDYDIGRFVLSVAYPIKFRRLVRTEEEIKIEAGPQAKAMLIGRNSANLNEMKDILKRYFKINLLRVV